MTASEVTLAKIVMLGKTVPEPKKRDGRIWVCSAGFNSETEQLIRMYPLSWWNAPKRWQVCEVPLERNPEDHRPESWKLAGDRSPGAHMAINKVFRPKGELPKADRAKLLASCFRPSIAQANKERISLALISPKNVKFYFKKNAPEDESDLVSLFDKIEGRRSGPRGSKGFPYTPHLKFTDEDSDGIHKHDLQLRDWGAFEFMRKYPPSEYMESLAGALHLDKPRTLLVGNMNNYRRSWLVISVLGDLRLPEGSK